MQNQTHILTLVKKLMIKILILKFLIMLGYQDLKIFLQKVFDPDWSEEAFVIKNIKNICTVDISH